MYAGIQYCFGIAKSKRGDDLHYTVLWHKDENGWSAVGVTELGIDPDEVSQESDEMMEKHECRAARQKELFGA